MTAENPTPAAGQTNVWTTPFVLIGKTGAAYGPYPEPDVAIEVANCVHGEELDKVRLFECGMEYPSAWDVWTPEEIAEFEAADWENPFVLISVDFQAVYGSFKNPNQARNRAASLYATAGTRVYLYECTTEHPLPIDPTPAAENPQNA